MNCAIKAMAFAALIALAPLTAAAASTPFQDLIRVQAAFQQVKSFHVEEHMANGKITVVDYVAPDRWRIQSTPSEAEVLIGNDVYMVSKGKTSHMPFLGGFMRRIIKHFEFESIAGNEEIRESARDLGMQTLDGKPVHVYSYVSHKTPEVLYVGADDLPLQAVTGTGKKQTTIVYSKYNAPISIEP